MTRPEFRDNFGNLIDVGYTIIYPETSYSIRVAIVREVIYLGPNIHHPNTPREKKVGEKFNLRVQSIGQAYNRGTGKWVRKLFRPTTLTRVDKAYFFPPDLLPAADRQMLDL